MRRFSYLFIGGAFAASLAGCQRPAPGGGDNSEVLAKLDEISKKLNDLEGKVEKAAKAGARPSRPSRPRPDAKATYSIPLGDSPAVGPEHAKVTIVEAFEYA
ncbi:MAG: hypothetical protein B7733_10015 [Myxococcales bacterium FL481]|nr:MAG: hypothetical protein B7733_10015 [Myxococcales bacterium FL481]